MRLRRTNHPRASRPKQSLASLVDRFPEVFEEIRGTGLLLGLKCSAANVDVVNELYKEHMLAVPAGDNVVRLLPPLNITDEEISLSLQKLENAAVAVSSNIAKPQRA